jgi:hypothetical protein
MTRRKFEITGRMNVREFPHIVTHLLTAFRQGLSQTGYVGIRLGPNAHRLAALE